MCKFCDDINDYKPICYYDNGLGYGTNYGIGIYAECGIKGNMLALNGNGHRWTRADDYYESWGLDVDGEGAASVEPGISKINFCPFCGKKLTDKTYEKEIAKRNLPIIEKNLKLLEKYKNYYGCAFRIQEYIKNPDKLIDKAAIFIPIFSSEKVEICTYHSSSRSLSAFDYDGMLPFSFSEWDLKYVIPYKQELFINLSDKDFERDLCGYERNTSMLMINNIDDVINLFDSIKEYNNRWKWNKKRTLEEINKFHNDVIKKITELENIKAEIENSIK